MIEITNLSHSPTQIIVRSKLKTRSFTTLNIPGRGKGKNKVLIKDEMYTDYIQQVEKEGIISIKRIND